MATKDQAGSIPIPGYEIVHLHRIKFGIDSATQDLLREIFATGSGNNSGSIDAKLDKILERLNQIMATEAEFQAKLDSIDANTTASAAAAQSIKTTLEDLRKQIADLAAAGGLTAEQEAALLAKLDGPIAASAALKTFLEATASTPPTEPEPPAVGPLTPAPSARRR